jgi:hypothetical protein
MWITMDDVLDLGVPRIRGRFLDPKATLRAEDGRRTPRELKWME